MTLETLLNVAQAIAMIAGAGISVWKIAATTGALGREIAHLGTAIERLECVVERLAQDVGALHTRVAVIEANHREEAR